MTVPNWGGVLDKNGLPIPEIILSILSTFYSTKGETNERTDC
jgi:hypothetical protein